MDSSSRTSVALAAILLRRVFGVAPEAVSMPPDLDVMLECADAALIIGDKALFLEPEEAITKIDLGELWTAHTGLPFVYAFWTGSSDGVTPDDVERLQQARDDGVEYVEQIAAAHFPGDPRRQQAVRSYLRDNIQYYLGDRELEGLTRFFRYASELGLASFDGSLRLYHAAHHGAR
jgi:chorismate dehydratase